MGRSTRAGGNLNGYVRKMILVIDESGAKGYSSNREADPGELGVMAGFIYPDFELEPLERILESRLAPFRAIGGKLHVSEPSSEHQHELREIIYDMFRQTRIRWIYSAAYVQGFHEALSSAKRAESLHEKLFQDILAHALARAHQIGVTDLNLEVRTDHVDSGVLKRFEGISDLLKDLLLRKERKYKKKPYSNDGTSHGPAHELALKIEGKNLIHFNSISIEINASTSALTVAADILANSVLHNLRGKQGKHLGIALNQRGALSGHPLEKQALVSEEGELYSALDLLYSRNPQPQRPSEQFGEVSGIPPE